MTDSNLNRTRFRLNNLLEILSTSISFNKVKHHQNETSNHNLIGHLSIADVTLPIYQPINSPGRYPEPLSTHLLNNAFTLAHLRWLAQKSLLGQDVYLLEPTPSCPFTKRLALGFCALAKKEYEYLNIHSDLTEGDLKQARELIRSKDGTSSKLKFVDSAIVRAAKLGRVLILDGIHLAERGILPLLNNLLENREMNLEDGTHIIHPDKYENLIRQGSLPSNYISASRSFMVICIGVPVPPFIGHPLDPPFRSRFQVRHIDPLGSTLALAQPHPRHWLFTRFMELIIAIQLANDSRPSALGSSPPSLPNFPSNSLDKLRSILNIFIIEEKDTTKLSKDELNKLIQFLHPQLPYLSSRATELLNSHLKAAGLGTLDQSSDTTPIHTSASTGLLGYAFLNLRRLDLYQAIATFKSSTRTIECVVKCGPYELITIEEAFKGYILTPRLIYLFTIISQAHALDNDISLTPDTTQSSSSSSILIKAFGLVFGYQNVDRIHLYKEMTGRELLMRRSSDGSFDYSTLVSCALSKCSLVELCGIELLDQKISVIGNLLDGRSIELWDGNRVMKGNDEVIEDNINQQVIGKSFRVICSHHHFISENKWGNEELVNLVSIIKLIGMNEEEEKEIMIKTGINLNILNKLEHFVKEYRNFNNKQFKRFSTRVFYKVCYRLKQYKNEEKGLRNLLKNFLLFDFLNKNEKMDFEFCLNRSDILKSIEWDYQSPIISNDEKMLIFPVSKILCPIPKDQDKEEITLEEIRIPRDVIKDNDERIGLVPQMEWFFENRDQNGLMRNIAIDLLILRQHLCLLGNQGVGKNKIVDRLLMLAGKPREYIQLHRDSTVQQLMFQTKLVKGKIEYLDSPLLKAIRNGRIIIIDEVDKAPEFVISILKSLAEDGEMSLSDGRKIVFQKKSDMEIEMNKNFKMILLANRPGFPFLGHHFINLIGDGFNFYCIKNPDLESEIELITQLLKNNNKIKEHEKNGIFNVTNEKQKIIVRRLVNVFDKLRKSFENGLITYPFSLRAFPNDSLEVGMRNVFDFDLYRPETIDLVYEAMIENGFKVSKLGVERIRELEEIESVKSNKIEYLNTNKESKGKLIMFGKKEEDEGSSEVAEIGDRDENGDFGDDTWGGGSGMVDMSGMGARAGSRKILRRTNLYQMPDRSTNSIPDAVRERAKALTREELEKKLTDLSMRAGEVTYYGYYYKPVQAHIPQLVATLENLEAKEDERVWVKGQTDGEFDERKLVDGLIGESAIYKRRAIERPESGRPQLKPKRIRFVFDISSSMYRFQADGRLDRSCQTAIMIMEAFAMLQRPEKYVWDIVGHAGDSPEIDLVIGGNESVRTIAERWKVIEKIKTFSQYALAGDHTVEAIEKAVDKVAEMESDEAIVIVISDANFDRYGITPESLKAVMNKNKQVKTALIGIGEGSEINWYVESKKQNSDVCNHIQVH
ncbi:hypothetical protein CROQUDRAFT_674710 [Cronartium quercuum f. sp. fusiforme G11]|uniref:ATPase dynein-related AAA domain-containing protein n=1 Tax=Cronartium quercuum f. sp. fusiforme G11 TaxID=708437 RepID=A0A9P6T6E7_9BASI|nr:hypothetical protein CROQUDRAFT_674710 [Cronartium quercuum f. sp. fusiforme G11]